MGRVGAQRAAKMANGQPLNGVRGSKVYKQRKKHKVVLEAAGEKGDDDNLRVVLSFHAEPPPGYTFIPAGNTQLTAAMKDFAKRGGHKIMAVSATPHAARHELSREVHRIGYHFPTEVVAQVCSHYGIRLDSSGRIVGEQDSEKLFMKISQKGQVVLNENVRDQVTINTEAKEIIRDLFPRIPDNDLFSIIKTAFQLGQNKVGTADEIPLVRRAQLSVVAHIRHTYTSYDRLLRQVNYNDARHAVEKETLIKLVEWRGDENDKSEESRRAVDDVVREVVVLSDEDESESELEEGQVVEDSNRKAKTVPQSKPALLATQHRALSPAELSPDEEVPSGYRFVPQPTKRNTIAEPQVDNIARQRSRYAVWDQVRQEYHSNTVFQQPVQVVARVPLDDTLLARPLPVNRELAYSTSQPIRYVVENIPPPAMIRQASPPPVFRGADGRFYERLPARVVEVSQPARIYTPPSQAALQAQSYHRRSASPRAARPQYHRRTPSMNDDGTIVQSIESPGNNPKPTSVEVRTRPQLETDRRHPESRPRLIDLTSTAEQAGRGRPESRSPPRPSYAEQRYRDAHMINDVSSPARRQLIELDHNIPPPRGMYQAEHDRRQIAMQQDHLRARPSNHEYVEEPLSGRAETRVPVVYTTPGDRRIMYERVSEQQPTSKTVRYVAEQPSTMMYSDRNAQAYHVNDYEQLHRLPPQSSIVYEESPRRVIVLDTAEPMDGIQRTSNTRYTTQYPTRMHN